MASSTSQPLLFLVTGSRGTGKTTFCASLARAAREAGWQIAGMLSKPVFENKKRVAIEAEDLRTGEKRQLAVHSETPTPGTKSWAFDDSAIEWGNQVLRSSTPCDLLIVDELGPLELKRGEGWQMGLQAVDTKDYAIAVVVIRAELLGEALMRWGDANLVEIDTPEDSARKARVLSEQLF